MAVSHKIFWKKTWEELCEEANVFLNGIAPEKIISVSHVTEGSYGGAIVWYVSDEVPESGSSPSADAG